MKKKVKAKKEEFVWFLALFVSKFGEMARFLKIGSVYRTKLVLASKGVQYQTLIVKKKVKAKKEEFVWFLALFVSKFGEMARFLKIGSVYRTKLVLASKGVQYQTLIVKKKVKAKKEEFVWFLALFVSKFGEMARFLIITYVYGTKFVLPTEDA